MKTFKVTQIQTTEYVYTVEAETEEQAIQSVFNSFEPMVDFDGYTNHPDDSDTVAEEISK